MTQPTLPNDLTKLVRKAEEMGREEMGLTKEQCPRIGKTITADGIRLNFKLDGERFPIDYCWSEVALELEFPELG